MVMDNIIYANESFLIQGALFDVYNTLGSGFLEAVYQEALELELKQRNIPFVSQKELTISYKGHELKQTYRADIVCYDKVILELKAVKTLLPEHSAQLHNYLCATGMKLGILVNFGAPSKIEIKRIVV
jgi:GxxExxY protein